MVDVRATFRVRRDRHRTGIDTAPPTVTLASDVFHMEEALTNG